MTDLFQRSIPEVLARSAERSPDKDAFVLNEDRLSYAGLVEKSQKLARILRDLGVQKGDRVGVFLQQSLESAVAIYGIMRAGAIFVPIDPTTPPLRMSHIIDRCDIAVLVTHPPRHKAVAEYLRSTAKPLKVIGLEPDDQLGAATTTSWPDVYSASPWCGARLAVQDLSYIMWTSGSTGTPKGMTHTHGNGLIYAGMLAETHDLNADDRFLGLSPLHFDMCVMDYVAAPLVGGTTIIVPETVAKLPAALTRLAAHERATIWYSVPFSMTQMLQMGAMEKHDLSALRWMIFGGEAFPIKHLKALMDRLPNARFANAYGPAETHQISSYTVGALTDDSGPIPIGEPWRTLEALILDEDDRPVAPGESGELVVRSPSCMRGYWRDPEQNAASFFVRPVSEDMDDHFYRTGDLVRQDADGMMHFLGRKGRQVKVRGYRIELDEVEAVLTACDGVAECAVLRSDDGTYLAAAVQLDQDATSGHPEFAAHCRAALPSYAVPAAFHIVDEFPRTGSDKIDRRALGKILSPSSADDRPDTKTAADGAMQ